MRYLTHIFWGIVILIGVLFVTLNSRNVEIHYFFGTFRIYLPLLLFIQLLLGALLGMVALLPVLFRSQYGLRKMKSRIREVEQEVKNLRVIPIKDAH